MRTQRDEQRKIGTKLSNASYLILHCRAVYTRSMTRTNRWISFIRFQALPPGYNPHKFSLLVPVLTLTPATLASLCTIRHFTALSSILTYSGVQRGWEGTGCLSKPVASLACGGTRRWSCAANDHDDPEQSVPHPPNQAPNPMWGGRIPSWMSAAATLVSGSPTVHPYADSARNPRTKTKVSRHLGGINGIIIIIQVSNQISHSIVQ